MTKEEDNIENEKIREINRKKKKKEIDIEYIEELIKKSKRKENKECRYIGYYFNKEICEEIIRHIDEKWE
ncbi:hypothetical protein ENUP19_0361G0047 [Entamoeba nuttalli]|uniref:Uncharacterized protein n=1 Tax=Entamoeba nuttalli TaxID=412467 RepID=A0ABQ0DYD2_9EUKA